MRAARPARRGHVHSGVPLLLLCAAFVAGCWPEERSVRIQAIAAPPPTSTELLVPVAAAVEPPRLALVPALRSRVEPLLRGPGVPAHTLVQPQDADVLLTLGPSGSRGPLVHRWIVVTDPFDLERQGVTTADLETAAAAARLFVAVEDAELVVPLLPPSARPAAVERASLARRLIETPGALALVAEDRLSVRLRALALDGLDPVRVVADRAGYPLVTRLAVDVRRPSPEATALAEALAAQLDREPPVTRAVFTGDLIPARCVYDNVRRLGDWSLPFRATGDFLRAADITVGSLDAALSDKGAPIGCRETFSLLGPPQAAHGFAAAGFDVITVATNHAKDCGASGPCGDATFVDTLSNLEAAGIRAAGGGRTLAEARRPAVVAANGVRFAFLGYDDVSRHTNAGPASPGTAPLDEETLEQDIAAAREIADIIVLLPQWGEEYTPNPTPRQRRIAARALAASATLIVGNHPHVVQAAGPVADGYVAYALGNFLFDQDWSRETTEGAVLEATFHGATLVAVRLHPIRIENRLEPVFLNGEPAAAVLRRITAATRRSQSDRR